MKKLLFFIFMLVSLKTYSQKNVTVYLEVRGKADYVGNIRLNPIEQPKKMTKADSLIDYASFKPLAKLHEPIQVINRLAEMGWELVSVTNVTSEENGWPYFPFVLYYFKKEIIL